MDVERRHHFARGTQRRQKQGCHLETSQQQVVFSALLSQLLCVVFFLMLFPPAMFGAEQLLPVKTAGTII
jgi:hypothetical protein